VQREPSAKECWERRGLQGSGDHSRWFVIDTQKPISYIRREKPVCSLTPFPPLRCIEGCMSDKPTRHDIDELVSDLEKQAREGKGKCKRLQERMRKRTSSQIRVSEETRRVRELEVQALEQKHLKEELERNRLKEERKKRKESDESLEQILEKYLKR
jgi:hypothetical protein